MATTPVMPPETETGNAPVVEQQAPPEPPTFGEKNRHLPDELKRILKAIVEEFQNEEMYDRRIEDITDRTMRFYDDGVQHVFANYGTGAYQIGATGSTVDLGNGQSFECGEYLGAFNIFRARRRTIDSVLTQNTPGIVFEPVKPERSEDIEAAETAEGYRHLFDKMNDQQEIQQAVTRFFELSGRVVARTYTAENQQKWGTNDQGQPRKMETCAIYGTLESTCPILCRDQDKAIYCFTYDDIHILRAKRENPWLKEETGSWKIQGGDSGPGESDWKRFARLGVRQSRKGASVINSMLAHIITEMHCYLRPDAFESEKCDPVYTGPSGWDEEAEQTINEPALNDDGSPMTVREFLTLLFPEGAHVKFMGKCYSESEPCSMDDAIDIVMSEKRDSMTGGALMEPMKIIQDSYNDGCNSEREHYEKGWPMTHFKGDATDYDAIVDQQSRPDQFNLIKSAGGPDVPLQNYFYKEPPMETPETFVQWKENLRTGVSQDITGASPALEGVAGPKEETASQRAMDKTQSIGILGPTWSRVQRVFAGIYKKAALLASKNPDHAKEITVATGEGQTTVIQLEKLTRGNFHCTADSDSTFPDSTGAQRANLDATLPLIAPTPIGAEMLSSPDNWQEILRVKGMNDFTLTPAIAFKKQQRELEILLREDPIDNTAAVQQAQEQHAAAALIAMQQGLPVPPFQPPPSELPSIMPKKRDYHNWELARCKEFLSSEEAWRIEVEGVQAQGPTPAPLPPDLAAYSTNPHIRNVELHADWHEKMMAMYPQPSPAPMQLPGAQQPGNQVQSQPPGAPNQATV